MHPLGAGGSELSLGTAEGAGQRSPPFLKAGNLQHSQQQLSVMPAGDPAGLEPAHPSGSSMTEQCKRIQGRNL